MPAQRSQRYALIAELNEEWARLIGRHGDRLPWSPRRPELAPGQDLAEVLAAIRHHPDPVLGALLSEATAGDALAGRVVLQAMLGKVVRLGQAYPDLGVDEFVAAMWCRIRTYPLLRRPTKIAANLALDTRKDVLGANRIGRRERPAGWLGEPDWERVLGGGPAASDAIPRRSAELHARHVIEVAETIGVIDAPTSSVLRIVYLEGLSSRVAAARLGTSPGMIRYRCSRGLRELARHAATLNEAA